MLLALVLEGAGQPSAFRQTLRNRMRAEIAEPTLPEESVRTRGLLPQLDTDVRLPYMPPLTGMIGNPYCIDQKQLIRVLSYSSSLVQCHALIATNRRRAVIEVYPIMRNKSAFQRCVIFGSSAVFLNSLLTPIGATIRKN